MSLPRCELTDLPRLLCACPQHAEWAFEWDDLTGAEQDYLGGLQGYPETDLQPLGVVRRLPEYASRPWSQPRDVKVSEGGRICGVPGCTRPAGDAFVCDASLDDLEVALGNVPGLLDDLEVLLTRQHRLAQVQRERKSAEHTRWDDALAEHDFEGNRQGRLLAAKGYNRVPFVKAAGDTIAILSSEVTSAVRSLCEPRGVPLPRSDAAGASRWLLANLATVALDPSGPDVVVGVLRETNRAMRIIDRPDDRVYIGICDHCQAAMHANPDLPEHRCTCGAEYVVAERRDDMRERLMDSLLSLSEIAELSQDRANFGERLTRKQLEGWVRRNRLVKVGSRPDGPEREVALYRAGDVLGLVSEKLAS